MSTTFAIFRSKIVEAQDFDPEADFSEEDYAPIARRSGGEIRFTLHKAIVEALPDSYPVYPIDNSAQGVRTVGDLKKEFYLNN